MCHTKIANNDKLSVGFMQIFAYLHLWLHIKLSHTHSEYSAREGQIKFYYCDYIVLLIAIFDMTHKVENCVPMCIHCCCCLLAFLLAAVIVDIWNESNVELQWSINFHKHIYNQFSFCCCCCCSHSLHAV